MTLNRKFVIRVERELTKAEEDVEAARSELAAKEEYVLSLKRILAFAGPPSAADNDSDRNRAPFDFPIEPEAFAEMRLTPAMQEYFRLRRAADGDGRATPQQVYEGLKRGGYQMSDNAVSAQASIRRTLGKKHGPFHRFEPGLYGLREWYPELSTFEALQKRPRASRPRHVTDSLPLFSRYYPPSRPR